MPATPIAIPSTGESLLGIEPQLLQQVDPGWRYRMNLFTGRALTDTALDGEQAYRAGLLATLGQSVTAGTVKGLVLSLDTQSADPVLSVTPGYGIAASGEDVTVLRTLQTNLSTLAVIDPVTGQLEQQFETYRQNAASTHAGILVLQPIVAQVSGQAFDTGTGPIEVSGNLGASCDQDPQEYAFEDWQIADGARLAFVAWPSGVAALPLPDSNPAATWRNRLAYTIFDAEAQLAPDAQFPWMMLGVPLAVVAFDASWSPLFIDRSAVVRPGGLPRRRYALPSAPQQPLVWQANTIFSAGALILDSGGNVQQVQTAGMSGNAPPKWNAAKGQPTTDGAITWTNIGPGRWSADTQYAAGESIFDSNGNVQTALLSGLSGSSQPTWNDVFLPTQDNAITWVNNQIVGPSIVQPALAQARIAQLAEQVGDRLSASPDFGNFSDTCAVLPPSGILPVAAVDLVNKTSVWLPPNWSLSAGPVHLEELEAALQTGMLADPIEVAKTADPTLLEDVEVLVPLPDLLYDPDILVTETVAPDFQREIDNATLSRNGVLHARKAIQLELNALIAALGPNSPPPNPSAIDPNAGLTPAERAGRDALPPSFPQPNADPNLDQTFGTIGPATWQPDTSYIYGQFVIDSNGNIQKVQDASGGTSGGTQPTWNPSPGGTTTDETAPGATNAITWFNNGPGTWQPNAAYAIGQFIFDANGSMQTAQTNGTSGASPYIWNATQGGQTTDGGAGGVTWVNDGPAAWQSNHAYAADQVLVDSNGNLQVVQSAGTSGASQPQWETDVGEGTPDGPLLMWINEGPPTIWEPNTPYELDQCMIDQAGNIQEVQTAGTSGSSQLIWKLSSGETTADGAGGLTWINSGPGTWQSGNAYTAGQFVLDSNGNIQTVQSAGSSAAAPPAWNTNFGQTTPDLGVIWINYGPGTWQGNTLYAAGQFVFDVNGNVQTVQTAGKSGTALPSWATGQHQPTTDGAVTWISQAWVSSDVQELESQAAAPPYTVTYTDENNAAQTITLIQQSDWDDLANNGLQHFVNTLNAKIKKANDLLDLAFLTSQTDIYRFRQNVMTATDATKLATSPVLANIATGETAAATAGDLQTYFTTLFGQPPPAGGSAQPQPPPAEPPPAQPPPAGQERAAVPPAPTMARQTQALSSIAEESGVYSRTYTTLTPSVGVARTYTPPQSGFETIATQQQLVSQVSPAATIAIAKLPPAQQITEQAPIVGAQLNVRTLTIAERLAQAPSQESLFYAIGNRLAFMQALQTLDLTLDDLQFVVDGATWQALTAYAVGQYIIDPNGNMQQVQSVTPEGKSGSTPPTTWSTSLHGTTVDGGVTWVNQGLPIGTTTTTPATTPASTPIPPEYHYVSELSGSNAQAVIAKIQNPYVVADIDEAGLFSVGVRVVEQHTQLLRALEGRVQTYADFVNLCNAALSNVQNNVSRGQTLVTRLDNGLAQARQDLAFTASLLADEQQRVNNVNAQRTQVLQTSVQFIVYTRPRTLDTTDDVPSRQLVPGNVTSPVPTCLQQSVAVPPELREIVSLLRDAPTDWMPSVERLLNQLDRPILVQQVATDMQVRATSELQVAPRPSSALASSSVYAPAIANVYSANQQVFRGFQLQRAAFPTATLTNQSWRSQVATLAPVMGIGDLLSSEAVHAEVANATSLLMQQISSVATCVYTRANLALPVDRLAWAEFLRGPGLTVQLQNLAALPNWNSQAYVDRQQMQLLVDWLFQQIDVTNAGATAYMSDVVRVSILLASYAPVNNVIAGAVTIRTQAAVGNVVSLTLPSVRVAGGMFVQLYSQGNLAADAVVSDLDGTSVTATVTSVHQPGVYLEANDVAHFTAQPPQAVALRAFAG